MTARFAFDSNLFFQIAVWLIVAGFALAYVQQTRKTVPRPQRRRGAAMVLAAVAVFVVFAIGLPRVFALPAVTMSVDSVWCAPWSEPLAWQDVVKVRSIVKEGYESSSSRYPDGPSTEALVFVQGEAPQTSSSSAAQDAGFAALRPLIWLTRWSFGPIQDALNSDDDRPAFYCNTASLDWQNFELKRLADVLTKAQELARDPDYPGYLDVIRLCEADGRTLEESCANYIWSTHRQCEGDNKIGYDTCMAEYFAARAVQAEQDATD